LNIDCFGDLEEEKRHLGIIKNHRMNAFDHNIV